MSTAKREILAVASVDDVRNKITVGIICLTYHLVRSKIRTTCQKQPNDARKVTFNLPDIVDVQIAWGTSTQYRVYHGTRLCSTAASTRCHHHTQVKVAS